ncbi:MAG: GTP-binding protein, partial [Polaribacter sp.]|nr:GTP-binding protein [Polaribacter sp.]
KENNTTELKGLFGPKPQVWTFFMFIHFVVGGLFLISATMLYSKISLKEPFTFPLILVIVLPIIWILLYFFGTIGKDTGKPQIKYLHDVMIQIITNQL